MSGVRRQFCNNAEEETDWFALAKVRLLALQRNLPSEVDLESANLILQDAEKLLLELNIAGLLDRPSIGWDDDASISIYAASGDLIPTAFWSDSFGIPKPREV